MFIIKMCRALEDAKVPYAIVGGYAVALHGVVRGTVDIDLVIKWSLKNLKKTEETFKKLGLRSALPISAESIFHNLEEYIEKRNLLAWNFYNPSNYAEQVDLIIAYDLKKATTKVVHTASGDVRILSRKDLIEMKRRSGRPQDLEDIRALEGL